MTITRLARATAIAALFGGTALAGTAFSAAAMAADWTMRISHQWSPGLPTAKLLDGFEKTVEEKSGGRLDVQIFPAMQLYKADQQHAAVAQGLIEATVMPDFTMGGTVPEMVVSLIPFLVRDEASVRAFPSSKVAELLEEKLRARLVEPIGWTVESRSLLITSNGRPLSEPEAFKGVKIRGLNPLYDKGLAALGATPTAMPAAEIYQALQTGIIDATVTGTTGALGRKFYEVQEYGVVAPGISFAKNVFLVNPGWWQDLPDDIRRIITDATDEMWTTSVEANLDPRADPAIEGLETAGMKMTVLDDAQSAALAQVMAPPVMSAFSEMGRDARRVVDLSRAE